MRKTFVFLSILTTLNLLSQKSLKSYIIYKNDTIPTTVEDMRRVVDSIKSSEHAKFIKQQDSLRIAELEQEKDAPQLYSTGLYLQGEELIKKEIEEKKLVVNPIFSYSDISLKMISLINEKRKELNLEELPVDTMIYDDYTKDVIVMYYNPAVVVDIWRKCTDTCYNQVIERILCNDKLRKQLLSKKIDYFNISIVSNRSSVTAYINVQKKGTNREVITPIILQYY